MASLARKLSQENGPNSRNKENIPRPASVSIRNGRSSIPSLARSPERQKQDFFTDSYLADTASQSSIPSPRTSIAKSRRKVEVHGRPRTRPTTGHSESAPSHHRPLVRRTSPVRSNGLTTPPRSRQGSFVEGQSPAPIFSSPPAALAETYTRIDQEEDLAATDGGISDPDLDPDSDNETTDLYRPSLPKAYQPVRVLPTKSATPPTREKLDVIRYSRNHDHTTRSNLSDPTGMSFVNQLSDVNLRHTLTPHFQQRALERDALDRVWAVKKSIAFGKAKSANGQLVLDPDNLPPSISSSPLVQPDRIVAFSKAARITLPSDHLLRSANRRSLSDVTDRIYSAESDKPLSHHNDNWHNDSVRKDTLPSNPHLHREPYFPKVHGFPARDILDRQPAQNEILAVLPNSHLERRARSESPYVHRPTVSSQPLKAFNNALSQKRSKEANGSVTSNSADPTDTSSDIWAHRVADRPIQSVEPDLVLPPGRRLSDMHDLYNSPDISRRMNFDLTGQSIQVSDSPPVRSKTTLQDYERNKEIRGLAEQAVTTNRLTQLRARESVERFPQSSPSSVSEPDDRLQSEPIKQSHKPDPTPDRALRLIESPGISSARPTPDRSSSHDLLQRLARRSGSTSRSTTPSDRTVNGTVIATNKDSNGANPEPQRGVLPNGKNDLKVQETPRITGAWTDTILPNTIRTVKRQSLPSQYTQTPHVSAGGWIDTPAPPAQRPRLETLSESTQEIPAGLTDGIVKDIASDRTKAADSQTTGVPSEAEANLEANPGPSITRKILETAPADPNDSLVIGEATMQSLQNCLDMDETELTMMSRLHKNDFERSDTEVLDRLCTKVGRIFTHVTEAKEGLLHLEEKLAQSQSAEQKQTIDGIPTEREHTSLPFGLITLSIPIPILFRRRNPGDRHSHPTPLGWALLLFSAWYLLECSLAEIYSHPISARHYIWPDEAEPEFPWVLPTMLWRWSKLDFLHPCLIAPAQSLVMALFRLVSIWFGFADGYVDGPGTTTTGGSSSLQMQMPTQTVEQAFGFDMTNDEFL